MSYLAGVAGLLALAFVYVGLGLADRGRKGCGGCALRDLDEACGASCASRDGVRAGSGRRAGTGSDRADGSGSDHAVRRRIDGGGGR